jgi:hypothetical protein
MSNIETVKKYYGAFDRHDLQSVEAMLHEGFRFTGPLMQASGRQDFLDKMRTFDCAFKTRPLHIVESGNTVGVLLECSFTKPFSATIRMSEWFAVENGKIVSSDVVYDTRQMPMAAAA